MNRDNKGVRDHARSDAPLALTVVASTCSTGTCPTVYETDRGTLVVQGYTVAPAAAGIDVPAGEQLVEIPADLLAAVMQARE